MKKILITGGNSGLGEALVKKYNNNGYEVYATYNKNNSFDKIDNVKYFYLDLDNDKSINDFIMNLPNIDILINNAGISNDDDIKNKTYEDFRKIISTNLIGTLYLTKKVAIEKMNMGHIVFITSDCAFDNNYPESIEYDASKAGLTQAIKDFAIYLSPNIKVNGVAPGWINTPMNKEMNSEYKKEVEKDILLNRFAEPEEIANTIFYLTSDDASYINGTTIIINGGTK